MMSFAALFDPMARIASTGGPMKAILALAQASANAGVDLEITLGRWSRANQPRPIGHGDVLRIGIRFRIDGHGAQTKPPRRANNTAGDLAAICDQDAVEHIPSDLRPTPM
jgi:hypothetical protein